MQARAFYPSVVFACLVIAAPALAQEGHPLVGSWHGDWGPNRTNRTDLTVIMDWDGKALTWSGGWTIPWQTVNYDNSPGGEIHEYFCHDNERDSEHFDQQEGRR